jgi:hypothetical protein
MLSRHGQIASLPITFILSDEIFYIAFLLATTDTVVYPRLRVVRTNWA